MYLVDVGYVFVVFDACLQLLLKRRVEEERTPSLPESVQFADVSASTQKAHCTEEHQQKHVIWNAAVD